MHASYIGNRGTGSRIHHLDCAIGNSGLASLVSLRRAGSWRVRLALVVMMVSAILVTPSLMAAPTTYSGEAPVADQSEGERAGGLKNALGEVVIRLSGEPGILARGNVAAAVGAAGKYVLQYSYRRDSILDEASGAVKPQLVLVAEFDSTAVDRMLVGLGLGGAASSVEIDATPVEKRIWLSNIHSAADYARGIGYLSRQPQVRQSWPIEARGDGILIHVVIAGDFNRWLGQVDQDRVIQVNSTSPPVQGIDATLSLSP